MSCVATGRDLTQDPVEVFIPEIAAPDFSCGTVDEDGKLIRDIALCIGGPTLTMPDKNAPELDVMMAHLKFEKPGVEDARSVAGSIDPFPPPPTLLLSPTYLAVTNPFRRCFVSRHLPIPLPPWPPYYPADMPSSGPNKPQLPNPQPEESEPFHNLRHLQSFQPPSRTLHPLYSTTTPPPHAQSAHEDAGTYTPPPPPPPAPPPPPPLADRTGTVDPPIVDFETAGTATSPSAHSLAGCNVQ
ncbi:hypothetical protein V502_08814, partial [Pseudogymnoascus sp. VKM F-4520 (FW-2644)]